ncbi:MAG: YlxR family protein [Thermoanaerobacterales bacterium]|nr:YlxR family protein [Thermoanaerobacterales bacterium]
MKPKKEMTRIVKTVDGNIEIDRTGKKSGRGTYVCENRECIEKALRVQSLSKALDTKVTIETVLQLKEDLSNK